MECAVAYEFQLLRRSLAYMRSDAIAARARAASTTHLLHTSLPLSIVAGPLPFTMAATGDLTKFLLDAVVPPSIGIYIVSKPPDGLGMQSVSDFASAFKESDYEDKVQSVILDKVPQHKEDIVALARLRTAWQLARSELTKACKKRVEGTVDPDWDTPLKDEDEDKRRDEFDSAYDGLQFDTESQPAAPLIARYYREFRGPQRHVSLTPLAKVRSEADFKNHGATRKKGLGDGVSIVYDDMPKLPDQLFSDVVQVLSAIRVLTNCWALTGANLVTSKSSFDEASRTFKKVRQCHLTQATSYADFCQRKALEHPGQGGAVIQWLLNRDKATRAKAKSLFAAGWPWGEAMQQARETSCAVLWTVASTGVSSSVRAALPAIADSASSEEDAVREPKAKRQRRKNKGGKKKPDGQGTPAQRTQQPRKDPCPKFNSAQGCTKRGRDCPQKLAHVCSKCGGWNHGAHTHR